MAKLKITTIFVLVGLVIFLNFVFYGRLILPQIIAIGPITIHYYGIIMALAVASGWWLARKRAIKYNIHAKIADDIIFWLIIGGFIGARLYHVLSSFDYYRAHIIDIFKVWQGGLSIYGAIFGGLITLVVVSKILYPKSYILNLLDWLTPSAILGQIIGRFGNLFNYEAFGYPTNLPWKMFVPVGFRPEGYQNFNFFHPWFLYEQAGLLIIFLIIGKIGKSDISEKQNLFIWYLLLYNTLRFGLEFLRADSTFIGQFRLNSIVSFILILIIILVIILRRRKNAQLS